MKSIYIDGEVGYDVTLQSVLKQMPKSGDINVLINSPGGSVAEGLAIYNTLKSYTGGKVYTTVIGQAASMGSVILQAGDVRRAFPSAEIMIHKPYASSTGNADDLMSIAKSVLETENTLLNIYANSSRSDVEELRSKLTADWYLTAEEALAENFIDEVEIVSRKHVTKFTKPEKPMTIRKKLAKQLMTFAKSLVEEVKALEIETNEGTFYADAMEVGQIILDQEDQPVENGTYITEDSEITVQDGIITEITPIEPTEEEEEITEDVVEGKEEEDAPTLPDNEELIDAQTQVEELTTENERLQNELEVALAEIERMKQEMEDVKSKADSLSKGSAPKKALKSNTKPSTKYAQDEDLLKFFS